MNQFIITLAVLIGTRLDQNDLTISSYKDQS